MASGSAGSSCGHRLGWATINAPSIGESAAVLLRVSNAGIEVLNLGTSVCTADAGIPADVAAQIAPPGVDPAGDCPSPAPAQQPSITVSPSTAAPGDTITFSGNIPVAGDCPPGDESARLTSTVAFFPPDGFGPQAPRDADGNFQVTYTIPTTTAPGDLHDRHALWGRQRRRLNHSPSHSAEHSRASNTSPGRASVHRLTETAVQTL